MKTILKVTLPVICVFVVVLSMATSSPEATVNEWVKWKSSAVFPTFKQCTIAGTFVSQVGQKFTCNTNPSPGCYFYSCEGTVRQISAHPLMWGVINAMGSEDTIVVQ
jgi:hypothetical protein